MLFYQSNNSDTSLADRFRNVTVKFSANLVPGLCPAGAGEVHERAQLPASNLHSDTHQQPCMDPIDRLMVAVWL